jgi:hypothetical protein
MYTIYIQSFEKQVSQFSCYGRSFGPQLSALAGERQAEQADLGWSSQLRKVTGHFSYQGSAPTQIALLDQASTGERRGAAARAGGRMGGHSKKLACRFSPGGVADLRGVRSFLARSSPH